MNNQFVKDPGATLDYVIDLKPLTHGRAGAKSDYLEADETISTHSVVADNGITVASSAESDGAITIWLSGGQDKKTYQVTATFTTNKSRTDKRTILVEVRKR